MVRIQDLTQEIKTIAILERVEAVHVAANCFRKGYVTTCTALSVEEQKRKKQARLARRGGNWAESKSGRTPESKRGRRPFGWDAVSRDGGRDNFFHGRERSEGEEFEATRGSTEGGAEWCTGFGEPAG